MTSASPCTRTVPVVGQRRRRIQLHRGSRPGDHRWDAGCPDGSGRNRPLLGAGVLRRDARRPGCASAHLEPGNEYQSRSPSRRSPPLPTRALPTGRRRWHHADAGPPTNDTCASPTPLTSGVPLVGQTFALAADDVSGSCTGTPPTRDVVYGIDLAVRSVVDVIVSDTTANATVSLMDPCGTPGACSAAFSPGEVAHFLDVPAGTHYLLVNGPAGGGEGTFADHVQRQRGPRQQLLRRAHASHRRGACREPRSTPRATTRGPAAALAATWCTRSRSPRRSGCASQPRARAARSTQSCTCARVVRDPRRAPPARAATPTAAAARCSTSTSSTRAPISCWSTRRPRRAARSRCSSRPPRRPATTAPRRLRSRPTSPPRDKSLTTAYSDDFAGSCGGGPDRVYQFLVPADSSVKVSTRAASFPARRLRARRLQPREN